MPLGFWVLRKGEREGWCNVASGIQADIKEHSGMQNNSLCLI